MICRYSGRIAAESFAHLQGMDVERVIVMGPCHRYYSRYDSGRRVTHRDCMLTQATQLETPGGLLDVDVEAQKALNEEVILWEVIYYRDCTVAVEWLMRRMSTGETLR